jgi:hypothetical protein
VPSAKGDAERFVMRLVERDWHALNDERQETDIPVESTIRVWVTNWTSEYLPELPGLPLPAWAAKLRPPKRRRGHSPGNRQPPDT